MTSKVALIDIISGKLL